MTISRPITLAVAVALLLAVSPARADTRSDLDAASKRLRSLEADIAADEAQVGKLRTRLRDLGVQVDRRRADAAAVQRQLRATTASLNATEAEYTSLREQLGRRARATYVTGGFAVVGFVLGAASLTDFATRVHYAARIIRRDEELSLRTQRAAARLRDTKAEQTRLLTQKAALLRETQREERALEDVVSRHIRKLDELAKRRAQALQLVAQLRTKVRAEELARLARVAGRGMPITFAQWAGPFLGSLGASASRNNMIAVIAWETAESTMATWNPLATTYAMPGATVHNSHGVRNYVSQQQGVDASRLTLGRPNHGYERIVSNLRASADPTTTAEAIRDSDWCRGCAGGTYVVGIVPAVAQYYDQSSH